MNNPKIIKSIYTNEHQELLLEGCLARPHKDGVGDVGPYDCGICYACQTMDGDCVNIQKKDTYLKWYMKHSKGGFF